MDGGGCSHSSIGRGKYSLYSNSMICDNPRLGIPKYQDGDSYLTGNGKS